MQSVYVLQKKVYCLYAATVKLKHLLQSIFLVSKKCAAASEYICVFEKYLW